MLHGRPHWGAFGGKMKKTLVVVICICFVFISCTKKEQTKIEQNSEVEKDETIIFNNDISTLKIQTKAGVFLSYSLSECYLIVKNARLKAAMLEMTNKIVIKNDVNEIELVLCKDESDAVRFYNKTEEWIKRDKIKQVLFMGDYSSISDRRRKLEDELIALTGWTKKKVQMKNNTYYRK